TSTFSPIAASAVPRLMAVVVLPTPPFWLASASTRGVSSGWCAKSSRGADSLICGARPPPRCVSRSTAPSGANDQNSSVRTGQAGYRIGFDDPIFGCFGQFSLYILPLWEQAKGAVFQQRFCQGEQIAHRCQRPGSDHIG